MKTVSNNIKQALKQPTTQRKGRILVNGNYYDVFNVEYYADCYNEGKVIGNAIASQLDFEIPYMPKFDTFQYFDCIMVGNSYEYIDYGTFTVFDEKDQDEFNKRITAFDNLIKFNKPFEDVGGYPKSLYSELLNLCTQAGVTLANNSIPNGSFSVVDNQFVNGESLKTVLKQICAISGTYATIKNNDLYLQLVNTTNEEIDKSQHEPVDWKRRSYGINQVILGDSQIVGEYVIKQDDDDIAANGVHKLEILDNLFANTQAKRSALIDALYEQVHGFGYIPYETKGEWLSYLEIGDTINIDGTDTILLRVNAKSPNSLETTISAPAIIDSSIEYVDNTNDINNKMKLTERTIDKQNQIISDVASNVSEQNEQIAEIRLQYNEILSRISDIADITVSGESSDASVNLLNVNTSQPISIKIHPILTGYFKDQISYWYPKNASISRNNYFPSADMYLKTRVLRFTNNSEYEITEDTKYTNYRKYYSKSGDTYTLLVAGTDYTIGDTVTGTIYQNKYYDWTLPTNLLYSSTNPKYDELELSYGDGTNSSVIVTRRCQIDSNGYVTNLTTPTTETYDYPSDLVLDDGDYTVTLLGYDTAYLYVQLMAKNIYTTQFYTRVETNSLIDQTATSIDLSVDQKLSGYSTTSEMNSAINIKANEITSSVSETYATKTTTNTLSSRISQTAKDITLQVNNGSTSSGIVIGITKEDGSTEQATGTIQMNGLVKFTNLYDGTTTISGSNIKTGTIDASVVNVTNINASNIKSGTINGDYIYGGTITGTNLSGAYISGGSMNINDTCIIEGTGKIYLKTTYGFLSTRYTYHPYVSALNIGYGSGGLVFGTGINESSAGSELGNIHFEDYSAMYIESYGTININHRPGTQSGGNVGICNIVISGATITGGGGGSMYANYNCAFQPVSGYYAYVGSTSSAGNRIKTDSGGPSSLNVKKNLKTLDKEYDLLYKDIQKVGAYNYEYKYKGVKDNLTKDYGFIIDEIENTKHLSKYFRNYDAKRWIDGDTLRKPTNDEEDLSYLKEINIKEWESDSYIKGLFVMIKTLQHKIDKLEEKINE